MNTPTDTQTHTLKYMHVYIHTQDVQISPLHNFRQYDLQEPLALVRCDNAKPIWRSNNVRMYV